MLCGCCAVSVILCVAMSPSGGGGGGSPGLSASLLGGDGRHGVWMLFGYYAGGIFVFLSDGVWL